MKSALLSLYFIYVFQTTVWVLLRRNYYLNKQKTKYVFVHLNDDNLKPELKVGTPGHAVLNAMQWFILVKFQSDIPKNQVNQVGDPQHTLSV
jgi:hypothetical protein